MLISSRFINFVVIIFLASAVILLFGQYLVSLQDLKANKALLTSYQYNDKVLSFTKLFVDKVLKAKQEVSFEDRLQLENAVRDINNQEIFDQWQLFTNSKTEAEAQEQVKNLIELLISKVAY